MKTGPKFKSLASAESAFKKKLEEEPLAPRTRSFYSETAHACLMLMDRAGLHTLPHEISAEDLRELLGHDSTEVTLRYIGVDLDDMRSAMQTELYA